MPITKDEIRKLAENFFNETPRQRVNQCGRITTILLMELESHHKVTVSPTRHRGTIKHNGNSDRHIFLTLPAHEIEDCDDGPVIIDPTIQQFTERHAADPELDIDTEVESLIDIPEQVGIYTPSDDAYQLYTLNAE